MRSYVGLDVSQATTAICVVDEDGRTLAEGKVPTCPRAIAVFVRTQAPEVIRIGLEPGPLAVWLFGALQQDGLPVICLDARHAAAGLALMANKTDRNDAAGIAQIVRTGWFRQVHVRSLHHPRPAGRAHNAGAPALRSRQPDPWSAQDLRHPRRQGSGRAQEASR